jgi:hypothetical protein
MEEIVVLEAEEEAALTGGGLLMTRLSLFAAAID